MTPDQEQLVTFLFIKHGGRNAVVDAWLFNNTELALTRLEADAVDAWLSSPKHTKPDNLQLVKTPEFQYLTAEITLDIPEID